MIKSKLVVLLSTLLILSSCGSSKEQKDEVCNCYKLFSEEVTSSKIDLDSENVSNELQNVYNTLKTSSPEFKDCTVGLPSFIPIAKNKMRMFCAFEKDCVDCEILIKIADKGPYLYEEI